MKTARHQETEGLLKRGRVWWFWDTIPTYGRVRLSLKTHDLAEAITQARLIRMQPARYLGAHDAAEDAITAYIEDQRRRGISGNWQHQTRVLLEAFRAGTGVKTLREVTESAARKWLSRAGITPRSAASYLTALRTFYAWSGKALHWRENPVAEIIQPKLPPARRKSFLTLEQARKLLDACIDPKATTEERTAQKELKFALYCALHAGLRKGEIIAARPHWFDTKAGLLHVQNEADWSVKDRENRTIPLTDEFRAFLKDYGKPAPYMLSPAVTQGNALYRVDFRRRYNTLLRKLGMEQFTFHDLRRTFASLLVSRGVSIYKVAKWLGDGVAVVERHYGHLLPNDAQINDAWEPAAA